MLSDVDIRKAIKEGLIVITPLDKNQIGPASVDLTLSGEWFVFKKKYVGAEIDLEKVSFKDVLRKVKSESMTLEPGAMCLGKTVEKITLAPNISGKFEGRSRYARMGLAIHVTSALIQPGSSNHQILEIVNLSPNRLVIHKGMQVSQVVFNRLESPTSKPYHKFGKIAKNQ